MADDKEEDPTDESAASAAHTGSGDVPEPRRAKIEPEDEFDPDESEDRSAAGGEPGADDSGVDDSGADDSGAEDIEGETVGDETRSAEESDAELVGVGASTAAGRSAKGKPSGANARAKKDKATPKQRQQEKVERTTPIKFVGQSVGELRKVVYPTGEQLIKYFLVVLVFVLFIIAIVSLLDLAFGWAVFKVFA